MKIPGPDHPITLTPAGARWQATFNDQVIADSAQAIMLREASYPPVIYFPKADVMMQHLTATTRSTNCPYKGDASYFSINLTGKTAENAVWAYETPYPAMAEIAGYVAFYPNIVKVAHANRD